MSLRHVWVSIPYCLRSRVSTAAAPDGDESGCARSEVRVGGERVLRSHVRNGVARAPDTYENICSCPSFATPSPRTTPASPGPGGPLLGSRMNCRFRCRAAAVVGGERPALSGFPGRSWCLLSGCTQCLDSRRQPRTSQRPPGNHPQREGLSGRLEVGATHDPEQPTFRISEDRRGQFALLQLGQ
jgi:hypothetical protein